MSQNIQPCTVRGYLYGIICAEFGVYDLIPNAEIFFVRSSQKTPTANQTDSLRGDAKTVVRTASDEELKRFSAAEGIMAGKTDEHGFFCVNDRSYQGQLLDAYVCLRSVPGPNQKSLPLEKPICLFLGTYAPAQARIGWHVKLYIPQSIWCRLKRLVDVWTVAGRVTDCESGAALGDVTVIARDVDIVQSDFLGQDVTNSLGIFRIDYLGDAFRQGTIVDVELFGGPDIYFEVKDSGGTTLLAEPPSAGRQIGRCDSGPCKCVRLCVDLKGKEDGDGLPSAWIRVGTAFKIPDSPLALNDFDANGYAGAAKFVLTETPAMRGGVPRKTAGGDPIEYRFLVGNTTAPNNAAPLAPAVFTRIVGAGPVADQNLFVTTQLGELWRVVSYSPFETELITITAVITDLSAGGWLDVNKVIENRFIEMGRNPLDIPLFSWIPNGDMMLVNTHALPTVADVPSAVAAAGQQVPPAARLPIEKMSLRFETRNATTLAALPGSGKVLNSMIVSNNPVFVKLAIKEHVDSGDVCGIIKGAQPHVSYTIYHAHLQSANIHVRSNNFSYDHNLNDPEPVVPPQRLPLSGNTNPAVVNLNRIDLNLPGTLHKCSYLVTLTAHSRRHTGGSQVSLDGLAQTTFYYEP
ncbi:MAG: carboxypeptidase-like regulatory domain-containing protein [Pyrinomonadaceae bacterium]|nr:carboxypeptidase-like regulatory domain-containing protein [Pyrinomonadaceae bacterium]